jgi:hypothetical protein
MLHVVAQEKDHVTAIFNTFVVFKLLLNNGRLSVCFTFVSIHDLAFLIPIVHKGGQKPFAMVRDLLVSGQVVVE